MKSYEYSESIFQTFAPNKEYVSTIPCTTDLLIECNTTEENTMNTTTNTFESERRALRDLLYSIERGKNAEARKACHMEEYRPSTYGELRKLIKEQKIQLHPEYDEYEDDEEIPDCFSAKAMLALNYQKPDRKSYKETIDKIEKEAAKLKTHISIFPPEDSFKKLEAFESKTFH